MDFKDWRKSATGPSSQEAAKPNRFHGRRFADHIEEQIQAAQERGAFDNLKGLGKPLSLRDNLYEGEKSLGYSILKNNGYAPAEIELAREIRQTLEHLDLQRATLSQRGYALRHRRVPPFASEKRAYNSAVTKALIGYEAKLRELNQKILTLNLTAPPIMHRPSLDVEQMLQQFQESCSLFT